MNLTKLLKNITFLSACISCVAFAESSLKPVDDLNSPRQANLQTSTVSQQYSSDISEFNLSINELASQDPFRYKKALKVSTLLEKIEEKKAGIQSAREKAAIASFNAANQKGLSVDSPTAQSEDESIKAYVKIKEAERQESAKNSEKATLESARLLYISGNTVGLAFGTTKTTLSIGQTKNGYQLLSIGSDEVKVKSKSGFIRTISIDPVKINVITPKPLVTESQPN